MSLPNIAISRMRAVPEIQVSTAETSRKSSTESSEFWEETTKMLQDLSVLRSAVAELSCPCSKPCCPFKHDRPTAATRTDRSRCASVPEKANGDAVAENGYLTPSARQNVATYLESMRPMATHSRVSALLQQDCLVTEEPLAARDKVYFVRSSPSRQAMQRKRGSALRVSNSYPSTMNSLRVPSPSLGPGIERRHSLPNPTQHCRLGSSLDSLDSDRMQDIQRSFLREQQRHHLSNIELVQW